jgi:hypothetical protein
LSKIVKTDIIPIQQIFAKKEAEHELDLKAICVFAATGFFLDQDSYWKDAIVLKPASIHELDAEDKLLASKPWFSWHYSPRDISFKQALDEFASLFETIIKEQTEGKKVILPLSGGLDSRTQAVALKAVGAEVYSYSYQFKNGFKETKIAQEIARTCHFDFEAFEIKEGNLWDNIDTLFQLNQGYSDFTTPRQMAIYNQYANMGDVFSLGHWGDVLFDSMNLPPLSDEEEAGIVLNKILKRGGLDFASKLWEDWELEGNFEVYLKKRVLNLLRQIAIENTNAKLRAFKSLYWAPRWTSVNLSIFSSQKPITLPYYDQRMCEFICTIPEAYLKDRQLQIAYIKLRNPKLANIRWQAQRPFNLNNYPYNKAPYNVPYRVFDKLSRTFQQVLGKPYIQRNWELQFLGKENKQQLEYYLFKNGLETLVSESLIQQTYKAFFENDALLNAHALNILLVLSKFNEKQGHV